MNYHCKCNIQRFSKAKCEHLIIVPTFRTYLSGYQNRDENKTTDSEMRFCGNGLAWCPHQEIAPHDIKEQNGRIAQQTNAADGPSAHA